MEFLTLDREPRAVTTARHWVVDVCRRRGLDDATCDPLELVTAEMVGNAVEHGGARSGGGRILIALAADATPLLAWLTGDPEGLPAPPSLVVTVTDSGADRPRPRRAQDGETSGRGLALVDALTVGWGVTAAVSRDGTVGRATGKTTWALVPAVQRPSPPARG